MHQDKVSPWGRLNLAKAAAAKLKNEWWSQVDREVGGLVPEDFHAVEGDEIATELARVQRVGRHSDPAAIARGLDILYTRFMRFSEQPTPKA